MSATRVSRRTAGRLALEDLRRYQATVELARLLTDRDVQRMVLHALLVAVQACVDEALAECRLRGLTAETYRSAFEELGRAGAIPSEWVPELMAWASMRNVLAHFYPVLDLAKVHEAMGEVEPLERFLDWSGHE
jgi:uncharacterized protein YutE (UPF0331/DUF86 family)